MPFKKGNKGRPEGAVNKLTKTVRDTFAEVFNELQEDPNVKLSAFGKKFPKEFYAMASKLIPTEISGELQVTQIKVIRE